MFNIHLVAPPNHPPTTGAPTNAEWFEKRVNCSSQHGIMVMGRSGGQTPTKKSLFFCEWLIINGGSLFLPPGFLAGVFISCAPIEK